MSIDFNELRLVRKYGDWRMVISEFRRFVFQKTQFDIEKFDTTEAAWAAFLKEEDEDGEA